MLLVEGLVLPNKKVINLQLASNSAYVLTGPNGVGKSLLLKGLAYLYSTSYQRFEFEGKDIKRWSPQEYRARVTYLANSADTVLEETVEDFMQAPFKLAVYKGLKPRLDTAPYLKQWGLSNQLTSRLSSGQRQIISCLRALSLKSKILLLDEPTANLDENMTLEIERLLQHWQQHTQGSYLLVSHSGEQLKRLNKTHLAFQELLQ